MGNRGVLALSFAIACSAPQKPTPPDLDEAIHKNYEPLGIKADAKHQKQAVILGTDDKNGSTVLALPATLSTGQVDAMFVKLGGATGAIGGQTPVKLGTAPGVDGSVQVGIFEEMAGGAGPQWRAGVWISAFVAANTLGKDLTDFTFTASSGGYIDGASASGLMAAGFLATITGEKIDPAATMTGSINPDGTIGPVGGIPEKFRASIDKGKKRIGYPIGLRWARAETTGQTVDVVKLARDGGAEAVEIASVHDAYKLLTGKPLPEPVPVAIADMALDADTTKALDAKYKEWQQRLAGEWAGLLQLQQSGRLPAMLTAIAAYAQERAHQAEQLHKQGQIAGAYSRMLVAWIYTASATRTYAVLSKVQNGDITGAVAALGAPDQLDRTLDDLFAKIGAMRPATMGGHLLMMGAFQSALRGWGFKVFANTATEAARHHVQGLATKSRADLASPAVADELVAIVAPTMLLVGRTTADTTLASQRLEFEQEKTVNYMCSLPNVRRLSTSFQSASSAGIHYFDTILVEPLAQSSNITVDAARLQMAMMEPDYLVALSLSRLAQADGLPAQLKQTWGETSLAWNLMLLAANELAYHEASELIAKYYSLGVRTDGTGRVNQVQQEKAFATMLESAERTARSSARAARIATGGIPVQAKLAYQLAAVQRDGDINDKIEALGGFWSATAYSQTAVMLARN